MNSPYRFTKNPDKILSIGFRKIIIDCGTIFNSDLLHTQKDFRQRRKPYRRCRCYTVKLTDLKLLCSSSIIYESPIPAAQRCAGGGVQGPAEERLNLGKTKRAI